MNAVMGKIFGRRLPPAVFRLILCVASLWLLPVSLQAGQSVVLAWSPSISADIAGYRIYYGTVSGNYTSQVTIGNTNSATISGLVDGATYFFAATSLDGAGNESPFSNEAIYQVTSAAATLTASPGPVGRFCFNVSGIAGYQYVVQASTNLADWVSVQTNTAPFIYTETNSAGLPQCFYRAIYLPP
jgi:hypothetical protein